jgi:4-diphosphocytidyl-2-C-methyl-D-erythritol kinase
MIAVTIFDTLCFEPADSPDLNLTCRWGYGASARAADGSFGDVPEGADNIVWRAVERVRQRAGVSGGASIELTKRIPAAAGLGGASSDAAAALVAANLGWQLGWSREELASLAAELGSDIPFFLGRGAAICRGRLDCVRRMSMPTAAPPNRRTRSGRWRRRWRVGRWPRHREC